MNTNAYIVISPVRNEARHLPRTLATMRAQSCPPLRWVIVNDGSTDETASLAREAASQTPWIEYIACPDRGYRQPGNGVVDAFYQGFRQVADLPWSFVAKMDGDLVLPPDYFARLIAAFEARPDLGICSGDIYVEGAEGLELESPSDPAFHVRGAAKMYRRACWEKIGGLQRVVGFDTIDNIHARMTGWHSQRLHDLQVLHLRRTGHAAGNWRNACKNGIGANAVGYHPAFVAGKCLRRAMGGNPVEALGIAWGYLSGFLRPIARVRNKELIRYLRRQQWNRLLGRETIWR